jgi:hypothetical protein
MTKCATGWWFSQGTLVSSTNKIDCHEIAEIFLKVALNTISLNPIMDWIRLEMFDLEQITTTHNMFQLETQLRTKIASYIQR